MATITATNAAGESFPVTLPDEEQQKPTPVFPAPPVPEAPPAAATPPPVAAAVGPGSTLEQREQAAAEGEAVGAGGASAVPGIHAEHPTMEEIPTWKQVTDDPSYVALSSEAKIGAFNKWHADALFHASNDPEWQSFKEPFNQQMSAIHAGLASKVPPENAWDWFSGPGALSYGKAVAQGLESGAGSIVHGSAATALISPAEIAGGVNPLGESAAKRMEFIQKSSDPLLQWARQAPESAQRHFPLTPEEQALPGIETVKGGAAILPALAAGPAAPFVMAMQGKGEQINNDYNNAVQAGVNPETAARQAFQKGGAAALTDEAIWAVLPGPLRAAGDKYLIDKFGVDGVKRFLLGRVAQAGEGAVLGASQRIAQNTATGEQMFSGVGTAAGQMALAQTLFPRGKTETEVETRNAAIEKARTLVAQHLPQTAEAEIAASAQPPEPKPAPAAAETPAEAALPAEPHPETTLDATGKETAPTELQPAAQPAEKPAIVGPIMLNEKGKPITRVGKVGETHSQLIAEGLKDPDKLMPLLEATNKNYVPPQEGKPGAAGHGFQVRDPDGTTRFVGREEAGRIASENGQRSEPAEVPLQSQQLREAAAALEPVAERKRIGVLTPEELAAEGRLPKRIGTLQDRDLAAQILPEEPMPIKNAFQHVLDNSDDAGLKALAKRLQSLDLPTTIQRSDDMTFRRPDGKLDSSGKAVYDPRADAAYIQTGGSKTLAEYHTSIIHEGLHAAYIFILHHPEFAADFRAGMEDLFSQVQNHPEFGKWARLLPNLDEFVSQLSNKEFRTFLDRIPDKTAKLGGQTLLDRARSLLRRALGLREGSIASSAFDKIWDSQNSKILQARESLRPLIQAAKEEGTPPTPEEHEAGRDLMNKLSDHMSLDTPAGLSAKGAEMILEKGIRTYTDWKEAMTKAAGTDQIDFPAVWQDTKQMLQDYDAAKVGKASGTVKSQIAEATGLRDSAAIMKANMAGAVSRAEALTAILAAREQGGAAGRKAGTAETKADLKMADRWMAADQERVRTDLLEFVNKTLPLDERGRYIGRITRALRRPDLLRGDPGTMYRSAFRVMRDINARAEIVYKTDRINDIKAALKRFADSPSVDVAYRGRIKDLMEGITLTKPSEKTLANLRSLQEHVAFAKIAGEDPGVPPEVLDKLDLLTKLPIKDMSTNAVDQLHDDIQRIAELGKLKSDLLERKWAADKQAAMDEMNASESTAKIARRAKKAQPGEELTGKEVVTNIKNAAQNATTQADLAISPTDMIGDLLDGSKGTYNGWWSRNVKGKLDLAHNAKEAALAKIKDESRAIAEKFGLTKANFERVGVKGILNMIGRERIEAMGIEKRVLDKIQNEPLSEGEQAYYDYTRKIYDDLGLKIKDMAHRLYQMDVDIVEKYVPLMRDWAAHAEREPIKPGEDPTQSNIPFDEQATLRQLQEDTNYQRRTEQGFLQARVAGAKTAVKYNAQEVFERHVNDALHFLHAQPVLKMLGEIVATPEFKAKYGDIGQKITHDLLDTVATQGQVSGRLRWLDWARNSTSKGAIAFRLASNLVHMSQIPLAAYHAGGAGWWTTGLKLMLSKEGQAFLRENAAETFVRSGGEPAQAAVEAMGKISRSGFAIARMIDRFNAQATFLGRYAKELAAKGVNLDDVLGHPVDTDAQALSLRRMRRAVASPLAKDVPQLISRGAIGQANINVSVARSLTQFKNIFLDIWSNVRHDLIRVGTQDMKNIFEAMRQGEVQHGVKLAGDAAAHRAAVGAALLMGVALETGIKHYVKKGIQGTVQAITGAPPTPSKKDNETDAQQLQDEFLHHVVNRIPVMGNIMSAIDYSETGVPVVDALVKPVIEVGKLAAAKTPKTKTAHAIRGIGGAATVAGLPGISQAAEVAEPIITKNLRGGRSKGGVGGGL